MYRRFAPSILIFTACVGTEDAHPTTMPSTDGSMSATAPSRDLIPQGTNLTQTHTAQPKRPGELLRLAPTTPAWTGRPRIALVIGNGDYAHAEDLPKVHEETWLMAEALMGAGFEVYVIEDADYKEMRNALNTFSSDGSELEELEAALVHYSGHGARVPDLNDMKSLLMPIDVNGETMNKLVADSVSVEQVQSAVLATNAEFYISVLDACRNNPFYSKWVENSIITADKSAAVKGGLGDPQAPLNAANFIMAHSASAGTVALDGYYTPYLAKNIGACGEISKVLRKTKGEVSKATQSRQQPRFNDGMEEAEFHFHGGPSCAGGQRTPIPPVSPTPTTNAQSQPTTLPSAAILQPTPQPPQGGTENCPTGRPASEGTRGMHWVCVPGGDTKIGDAEAGGGDEKPELMVRFTEGFWMLETELTADQATAFGLSGQSGNMPRTEVSWDAARKVCKAAGGDLPTEFQWEHAARGGGREGSWGAGSGGVTVTRSNLGEYAWYDLNSDGAQSVKARKPNAFGLYDLWGNVWEWTLDAYDSDAYGKWASRTNDKVGTLPLLVNPGFVATIDKSPPLRARQSGGLFQRRVRGHPLGQPVQVLAHERVLAPGFSLCFRLLPPCC